MCIRDRSRGTPRIANRLLKRVRDYAIVKGKGIIDAETADKALRMLEIDEIGLDKLDRRILNTIIDFYKGGPVGIDTLAASIGEEKGTIEELQGSEAPVANEMADVAEALTALGFAYAEVKRTLGNMDLTGKSENEIIKEALKNMNRQEMCIRDRDSGIFVFFMATPVAVTTVPKTVGIIPSFICI